jgi:uncharacterized repeat protein (TIGR03803 family)
LVVAIFDQEAKMRPTRKQLMWSLWMVLSSALCLMSAAAWAATAKTVHEFSPLSHGAQSFANLILDPAGNLYGTTAYGGRFLEGTVFEMVRNEDGQWVEKVIHEFEVGTVDGQNPVDGLAIDANGNLYGITPGGGSGGYGVVFELSPSQSGSWTESILYNFSAGADGGEPNGSLLFDRAGNLYGTTNYGGAFGAGTVYELSPSSNGWSETVLYSFTGGSDGSNPGIGVVMDAAGHLYGATQFSNVSYYDDGPGVLFELSPSNTGWTETVLYTFRSAYPVSPPSLAMDGSGNLYGAGSQESEVFELSPSAGGQWMETFLHYFGAPGDGSRPAGVVLDGHGNLFGTTQAGGKGLGCYNGCGTVYELTPDGGGRWKEKILHNFRNLADGMEPQSSVVLNAAGNVFGTTWQGGTGFGTVFQLSTNDGEHWKKSSHYDFRGTDGGDSKAGMTADSSGALYGTTLTGGVYGFGAVFKLDRTNGHWLESLIYSFTGGSDGGKPSSGVIFDNAGNLYGTTSGCVASYGCGTVYELSQSNHGWKETTLYSFPQYSCCVSDLVFDKDGNLYGTTSDGGSKGTGTVFELTQMGNGLWSETTLHAFPQDKNDGFYPMAGLVLDDRGNIYGTTYQGGIYGGGIVFKLAAQSRNETVLHAFGQSSDGSDPWGTLVFDSGNLYGTTVGGPNYSAGAVFELSPPLRSSDWTEKLIHVFAGAPDDGSTPMAGLVLDGAGNLYGTTTRGGNSEAYWCFEGCGIVFELSPGQGDTWEERILYNFTGALDGLGPQGVPVFGLDGALYGTTPQGGLQNGYYEQGAGTIYQIKP